MQTLCTQDGLDDKRCLCQQPTKVDKSRILVIGPMDTETMKFQHKNGLSVSYGVWKMDKRWNWNVTAGAIILCLIIVTPVTGLYFQNAVSEADSEAVGATSRLGGGTQKIRNQHANAIQCYSCMSRTMGSLWEAAELDKIYMQQQSFTDHCHKPDEHRPVAFVRQCSFTCISMLIEVQFGMGARTQLRGCYDTIFRSGFNESSPAAIRLKYKDFCHKFNLSEVVKQRLKYDSIVEICSCRGQFCNGAIMPTSGVSGIKSIGGLISSIFKMFSFVFLSVVWRSLCGRLEGRYT